MQNKEALLMRVKKKFRKCSIQEKIVKETDYDYDYTFSKNKLKRLWSKNWKECLIHKKLKRRGVQEKAKEQNVTDIVHGNRVVLKSDWSIKCQSLLLEWKIT